jgi:trimeric autotransporter adhesin
MLSGKKKIEILAACATLLLFAAGVGCHGFFVDPVLTSVTVGPTATINQGGTVQESAVGTYNDGSSNSLTNVQWSSDTMSVATVNTKGLVSGVSPGTATITGASGTVSGTATITVSLSNVTGLTITPSSANIKANGGTAPFTAKATIAGGQPVDVTATVTWTVSDTTNVTVTQGQDPAIVTVNAAQVGEKVTLGATYLSGSGVTFIAPNATITVTQ